MAKANLTTMTEKWIDGKTERRNDVKTSYLKSAAEDKSRVTIYISKAAVKLLWHNRAETGEPASGVIERLVFEHLGAK